MCFGNDHMCGDMQKFPNHFILGRFGVGYTYTVLTLVSS